MPDPIGIKCRACARIWKHRTPVRAMLFVCGDCCKYRDHLREINHGGAPDPQEDFRPLLRLARRPEKRADDPNPCFENAVRLIEDREAA